MLWLAGSDGSPLRQRAIPPHRSLYFGGLRWSRMFQIQTQIRDPVAIQAACRRLGLPESVPRNVRLFSGEVTSLAVQLFDWRYPVFRDASSGQLDYDNYGGTRTVTMRPWLV